ncbi:MAG: aminopeptidase [Deferribacterota bacterium]|nr:aminopeptidase [Deferribacterota bacterium]
MCYDLEKKLADLICNYSIKLKEDEVIVLRGSACSIPLIKELYLKSLEIGAYPDIDMSLDEQSYLYFKNACDKQLDFIHETAKVSMKQANAIVSIDSQVNSKQLSGVDPYKLARRSKSTKILKDIMLDREIKGELRWNLSPYPTFSMAQDAELSYDEFREFVYKACKLDCDDPVSEWKSVDKYQENIINNIQDKKNIHIIGDKTDLVISVEGRKWINCNGTNNLPDGEIFTSPVEDSANGFIHFDYISSYMGNEVCGVTLTFENGVIINAEAVKGEKFLREIIKTDKGASIVGELAFGLNDSIKRNTKNILFDEKIGETMHLALGSSYPEAGGKNRSGIHWDLIKSMKSSEVFFDDELLYKNGKFVF